MTMDRYDALLARAEKALSPKGSSVSLAEREAAKGGLYDELRELVSEVRQYRESHDRLVRLLAALEQAGLMGDFPRGGGPLFAQAIEGWWGDERQQAEPDGDEGQAVNDPRLQSRACSWNCYETIPKPEAD